MMQTKDSRRHPFSIRVRRPAPRRTIKLWIIFVLVAIGGGAYYYFVYDVEAADAARRLRIRSALLTIIPAVVALRLDQLSGRGKEPYYLGGGQLLAPSTDNARDALENELIEMEKWLLLHSAGRIGIFWTSVPDTGDPKTDLQNVIRAVSDMKWNSGRHDGKWIDLTSGLWSLGARTGELGDPNWEAEMGAVLVRAGGVIGFRVVEKGDGWAIGPWKVAPVSAGHYDIHIQQAAGEQGITIGFPKHVPTRSSGDILAFDEIANRGRGAPYLAALKLDGDHMGTSMAEALDQGVAAYTQRSRAIRDFFAVTVPELLQKEFPLVYLIYSGGDDLAAVGHFYDILRAALRIHDEYAKLSFGTLSAGIAAFHGKSPVRMVIDQANGLLEEHAKKERDRVCVFGQTLTWEELDTVIREAEVLATAVEYKPDGLPRGMLQLLRQLHSLYTSQVPALQTVHFRALPLIQYFRSRRLQSVKLSEEAKTLIRDLEGGHDPTWQRIGLVATIAAWLTKSQENEE